MNNGIPANQPAAPRLQENINDKLRRHPCRDLPADDAARELILKTSQVTKAAALHTKIGNIADKNARLSPKADSTDSSKDSD